MKIIPDAGAGAAQKSRLVRTRLQFFGSSMSVSTVVTANTNQTRSIPSSAGARWLGPWATLGICAAMLVVFATLSYSASLQKSATYDEPLHVLGGFLHRHYKDFRVNPEDPALFGWLVSLPNPKDALRVDLKSLAYEQILTEVGNQWPFIWITLYRSAGNDEQLVLNRSRLVCTMIGVMLGAVIATWTYRLAGPVGAIAATALYALCPNFLAHASIVKNDVPLSCVMLGLMYSTWLLGRRGSWPRLAAVALLCGAALGIKYSGVLAGPVVAIALLVRALLPQPWEFAGINLETRLKRFAAAATTCVVSLVVAIVCVWAVYGFRFGPTPDPNVSFKMENLERLAKIKEIQAAKTREAIRREHTGDGDPNDPSLSMISEEEIKAHEPAAVVRFILWANERRLLPQGWLAGFAYTYATTLVRSTYLNGEIRNLGWWYFFPAAMLYKTPLATLAASAAALVLAVAGHAAARVLRLWRLDAWALVCLILAPALYGISAMTANLNLGLRHILPVYPFVFVGIGVVTAAVIERWRAAGTVAATLLGLGLAIETLAAYPNFIPFFNAAAGGARGGFELLGDSNLDWGQDLKRLAQWQRENPGKTIYLSYFGVADPEAYGLRVKHLPGGYIFAQYTSNPPQLLDVRDRGVIAVSATNLQGIYLVPGSPQQPGTRAWYHQLLQFDPIEVLGGSMYLYPWPLPPPARPAPQPSTAPAPR
jgi:hypothetical protein